MTATDDPYDLQRFLDAQEDSYATACAELRAGRKRSHWMWFIFPQVAGLGISPTAQFYGIRSRAEATAYLAHAVLGPRLVEVTEVMLAHGGRDVRSILGTPDDLKFCSCMTLFEVVSDHGGAFSQALEHCCGGVRDARTLELLGRM